MNIEKNKDKLLDVDFITIDNLPRVVVKYEKVELAASGTMQAPTITHYERVFTFSEYLNCVVNGL